MTHLQERWEGVSLPGDYLLEHWLSGDDAAGFFETAVDAGGRRALVKLVPESAVDAAAQLALWERVRSLRHPNLRELLDCGRAELGGEIALFAVFEPAEDTLASALAQSQLSESEARDVLESMLDALRHLQLQGLSHPALYPDQVVAVGERIKLSTEGLSDASPGSSSSSGSLYPFSDELRAFWYKISPCTLPRSADIFNQVVGPDGTAPPAESAPTQEGVTGMDAQSSNESVTPGPDDGVPAPFRFPRWIAVGAAGVVLLILALHYVSAPGTPVQPATIRPVASEAPAPPASAPTPVAPAPSPAAPASSPPARAPRKNAAIPAAEGKAMWRVIAFTYRSRDQAARKAEQVNRAHPDLLASVFSPREKTGYYLVALGGRMTREDAVRIQRKARTERVAHDAYVQNYLE